MTPEQAKALDEYRKVIEAYSNGNPLDYGSQGNLVQYDLGDTNLNDISTDPTYKQHELSALRELEDASQNGFTAQDRADILRTENLANRANRGRIESIRQNMQARGMGGGGLDLVAQMQSAQDANEMEALKGLEQQGMMQNRKRQATLDLGNVSSQLQQRDYQQAADKARARDAINQFNVENRNRASQYDLQNRQAVADRNVAQKNDWRTQQMQAQSGLATQNYNAATDDYNQAQMRKMERQRKRAGMVSGVLGAAGGVAGGIMGSSLGPLGTAAGASAGMQAGSALGNAFGSYAHGGTIPGDPLFAGDDPMNDIFTAELSPGERVIPRSLANDPEGAKKFVSAQMAGMDPLASKYVASADRFDAVPPPEPPRAASKKASPYSAPDSNAFAPVSPMALKALAMKNPSLVEQYKAKMDAADKGVKSAEDLQAYGMLANSIGKGLTDFGNSQKDNAILANRWQDMGKRPEVVEAERKEYDGSGLDKLTGLGVKRAEDDRALGENRFFKEQQLRQFDKQAHMDDPNSPESQSARAFLKSLLPNTDKIQGFDGFSASRLEKVSPMLMEKWKADKAQSNADREYGLKQQELGLKASQKKQLGEGQQKIVDYSGATLAGIQDMRRALAEGDNTFSVIGDNKFTEAARRAAENFGRLQSGGAINKDEEARFMKMLPGMLDDKKMQEYKLKKLENEMNARLSGLGQTGEEQLRIRGLNQYKEAPHGPRVIQNGVTFSWNGSEYVPEQ